MIEIKPGTPKTAFYGAFRLSDAANGTTGTATQKRAANDEVG